MIAIVKYNAGNTASVQNALNRLGCESIISDDPLALQKAEKVIFPGVGEANSAMHYLAEKGLDDVIKTLKQPVLGICLGMQLLCDWSEEGSTKCLGIFPNQVIRFEGKERVPHMGWNEIQTLEGELFQNIPNGEHVYYVHSYFAGMSPYTVAVTHYMQPFSAALQRDNFYATQFHPEKSAHVGSQILQNFLEL